MDLVAADGGTVNTVVVNLQAFLQVAFSEAEAFRRFLMERHNAHQSSHEDPWSLILYGDEYNPGLELTSAHRRKQWMTYCSFLELGAVALEREAFWWPLSACLTSEVDKLDSGYSQLMGRIVSFIFNGATCPRTVGVTLHHQGDVVELFFDLYGFLMDGLAHKVLWGTKGESGTRCCASCINYYAADSAVVADDAGGLTGSTNDWRTLEPATDLSVRASVARVAEAFRTCGAPVFKVWSQAIGFNHLPYGILNQPACDGLVKPVTQKMIDPSHTLVIGGVVNTVWFLYFDTLSKAGVPIYQAYRGFMSHWAWPHDKGGNTLKEIFSVERVRRWRDARTLKCHAAELMQIVPLLRFYVSQYGVQPGGACTDEGFVVLALMDVYEAVQMRRGDECTHDELMDRVHDFLDRCVAVGWTDSMHPKFHWLIHFFTVISALACEGKHRLPKRFAKEQKRITGIDAAVMSNIVAHNLYQLEDDFEMTFDARLVDPRPPSKPLYAFVAGELGAGAVLESRTARLETRGRCGRGDVVLLVGAGGVLEAGEVWRIFSHAGDALILASTWSTRTHVCLRSGSTRWQRAHNPELWPLQSVLCACIWRDWGANEVCLIVPHQYRHHLH
jgi:hypothetical protein